LEQVRQTHQHEPVAQADGVVDICEWVEAHTEAGHFGARPQFAIGMLEEFVESAAHRFKLARVARREAAVTSSFLWERARRYLRVLSSPNPSSRSRHPSHSAGRSRNL